MADFTLPRPNGLPAVIAQFGNPLLYIDDEPAWESLTLAMVPLQTPLLYIDGRTPITRIRAHHLLVQHLADTLHACLDVGVERDRMKFGGCYAWRPKRGLAEMSLHSWGIAVDLEPTENPLGSTWMDDGVMLDPRIIATFGTMGWYWGGNFDGRPDPQHFQFAEGC